jgi:glycine/D-amino acid oxidase-like deaminating enzyme
MVNGLVVVAGLSGSGIMKADSTGRIASALIDKKKHAVLYGGRKVKISSVGVSEERG